MHGVHECGRNERVGAFGCALCSFVETSTLNALVALAQETTVTFECEHSNALHFTQKIESSRVIGHPIQFTQFWDTFPNWSENLKEVIDCTHPNVCVDIIFPVRIQFGIHDVRIGLFDRTLNGTNGTSQPERWIMPQMIWEFGGWHDWSSQNQMKTQPEKRAHSLSSHFCHEQKKNTDIHAHSHSLRVSNSLAFNVQQLKKKSAVAQSKNARRQIFNLKLRNYRCKTIWPNMETMQVACTVIFGCSRIISSVCFKATLFESVCSHSQYVLKHKL